jgi:hypothetical protein
MCQVIESDIFFFIAILTGVFFTVSAAPFNFFGFGDGENSTRENSTYLGKMVQRIKFGFTPPIPKTTSTLVQFAPSKETSVRGREFYGADEHKVKSPEYCRGGQQELENLMDETEGAHDIHIEERANRIIPSNGIAFTHVYRLRPNGKFLQTAGSYSAYYENTFNKIVQIIPSRILNYIDNIRVNTDINTSENAGMTNSANDLNKFSFDLSPMNFNEENSKPSDKILTVVHEIGHLVHMRINQEYGHFLTNKKTLNEYMVNDSTNYYDRGSCYKTGSLFAKFVHKFYDVNEKGVTNPKESTGKNKGRVGVDYVSTYAKTDGVREDFAESFAHYILELGHTDKNAGLARFKINFFGEDANYLSDDLNMRELKKEFRDLIGKSEYCKEMSSGKK